MRNEEADRPPPLLSTLRGRIAAALVLLVALVLAGGWVYDDWARTYQAELSDARFLGSRLARVAADAEAGLDRGRAAVTVAGRPDDADLVVRWTPGPDPGIPRGWSSIAADGFPNIIAAAEGGPLRPVRPSDGSFETALDATAVSLARELRPAAAFIRLSDGSWLEFTAPKSWRARTTPVKAGLIAIVFLVGVGVLAFRIAGALAGPVERLAEAVAPADDPINPRPPPSDGPVEVRTLADAVARSRAALAEILEGRSRALAAISHDLRKPVTHLRLRADLIDDEALRAKILADVDEMGAMLAVTLDFLANDVLREAEEIVSLTALLQGVCDDQADMGAPVSLTEPPPLEFDTSGTVFGAPVERRRFEQQRNLLVRARPRGLRRAFANLVENAVKYGDRAEVSISADSRQIVVDVVDDGPGIPEDQMERVLSPFVRLNTSSEGSGLGLSVVKSVIDAHGGELRLINRAGGGLRVRVTLPRHL